MKSPCSVCITIFTLLLTSLFVTSLAGQQYANTSSGNYSAVNNSPQTDAARVLSTSMTGFGVPFSINDPDGRYIEVHLYVSKDRGQSWQYHDRTNPRETQFPFQTRGDGEYWFALKTLDRDRKLNPDGEPRPELKVIVDTRKPTLDLEVKADPAGRVVCKWRAEDRYIAPESLQISYKAVTNSSGQWKPVEYRPIQVQSTGNVFTDQLAWWPDAADQEIQVRLQVNDRAGNSASGARNVFVRRVATGSSNVATTTPPNQVQKQQPETDSVAYMHCEGGVCRMVQRPKANPFMPTGGGKLFANKRVGSAPEYAAPPVPPASPNRDVMTASARKNISLNPAPHSPGRSEIATQPNGRPPQSISWDSHDVQSRGDQKQVVASTAGQGGKPFDREQNIATATTSGSQNPLAMGAEINRQTSGESSQTPITPPPREQSFAADEPLHSPSRNMRNVAHPMTEDNAPKSARPLPTINNFNRVSPKPSPEIKAPVHRELLPRETANKLKSINSRRFLLNYNVDAIDPSGVGKVVLWVTRNGGQTWSSMATDNDNESPFPVQVDEDGEFGFRVVIHSKDGLVGRPPSRGDEADMWVRIDTEAPSGRIISVPYGTGNDVGRLVINWRANDDRLRTKPIDLAYSSTAEGPWTNIEQGIRNTGSYSWKVGRDIPDKIYLRMSIHDAAGNSTIQKLTQPIDVSGLVPRGRINSIQAITVQ